MNHILKDPVTGEESITTPNESNDITVAILLVIGIFIPYIIMICLKVGGL